jgi:uncharacterized phage protein gp47/JayE
MPRSAKSLSQMNADSLRYLAENTDITYLSEGSIARGLVETTNLEIARLQEYIASTYSNTFINTAQGVYLDLIGEMLGVTRLPRRAASTSIEDQNVQFSVATGTLGDKFASPTNANQGLIPAGITVQTADGSIKFKTSQPVAFPKNATEIFVPIAAESNGSGSNVGKAKLTVHDGPSGVNVTNLKSITNGSEVESDKEYRFRLANAIASTSTSNEAAIRLAVAGIPDISRVVLREFARGAGTFDVLLVPAGNTISSATAQLANKAIDAVSAFGISSIVRQPTYIRFRISVQLIPEQGAGAGAIDSNKLVAKNAILDYFESIPMGGELIINRLRAAIVQAISNDIKDIKIIDLCLNGRPKSIRNVKLKPDELFTPDTDNGNAIEVI